MSPRGGTGLTLLSLAFGFVALMLDQANIKSPVLVWVFGISACITALGALVAFFGSWTARAWEWLRPRLSRIRFRWPVTFVPTSTKLPPPQRFEVPAETLDLHPPDGAKEIEAEKQKLNAEIEELKAQLTEAQQTIRSQRKAMEDEHGVVDWGSFPVRQIGVGVNAAPLRAENDKLREELHQTNQQLEALRTGERRKRIERWRADIRTHTFARHPLGTSLFAETETYSEMRPHLSPKTRERFESQVAAVLTFIGPEHLRGREGDKRVLLAEVARIEKEWGVI
jgi:hypothetical protein